MKHIFYLFMVFNAGFVAALNMSRLVSTNPDYEAAWWKVAFAIMLAVIFGSFTIRKKTSNYV